MLEDWEELILLIQATEYSEILKNCKKKFGKSYGSRDVV